VPTGEREHWAELWRRVEALHRELAQSKTVKVNSEAARENARALVQHYFRTVRPELVALKLPDEVIGAIDPAAQELLRLANGRNRRQSYRKVLAQLRSARTVVELQREQSLGSAVAASSSGIEKLVLETLNRLVPTAALSYEQAVLDLRGPTRLSYRGAAVELRECVREVLDHLAPDSDVVKAAGFKLEKDTTRPTMRQKAAFILRARGVGKTVASAPQDAVHAIEQGAAALARSVYTRSSVSTHTATTREEVLNIKLYAESVLAELLQLHSSKVAAP
jgi:hypothetical protein